MTRSKLSSRALGGFDRHLQIAERTSQDEPALCELRGAARAHQKGDVDASGGETSTEITANAAGAENEYSHLSSPRIWNRRAVTSAR